MDLDYIVQAALNQELGLQLYYNRICELYLLFTNCQTKQNKIQYLADLRQTAISFANSVQKILADRNIPLTLVKDYSPLMKDTFTNRYLNLTQLWQRFTFAPNKQHKIQMLTALYVCLTDLVELALLLDTEPEKKLELIGE